MIQEAITNYKLQHTITTLSPLKAILFDMDGVIFDSMPYHALSWVNAFKQVGITFSEYEVYLNEGEQGLLPFIMNFFLKNTDKLLMLK